MENASGSVSALDFSTKTWKEDVVLIVEGKEFHVAKNVMAYISPVFDAMFSHPFSENSKTKVELPGKEYNSFLEFMRCIYPGSKQAITEENIFDVLPLADEYQVTKLMKKCEKFLRSFIGKSKTAQEVLKCLAVSERYHMNTVKTCCVNELESRQPEELVEADIDQVCQDTMIGVLKRLITRQQLGIVKHFIQNGVNEAITTKEFESFTDAKGAIIDFEAEDVSTKQMSNGVNVDSSPFINLWNFKFCIFVRYSRENGQTKFGIFLKIEPPENVLNWSCNVKGRLILKNAISKDKSWQIDHTMTEDESDWGFSRFEEVSEVLNPSKGFIKENKVQIAAVILANKPEFTERTANDPV